MLTEVGLAEGESLYSAQLADPRLLIQMLRAHKLFSRNVEYIVKDDQVRWVTNTPAVPKKRGRRAGTNRSKPRRPIYSGRARPGLDLPSELLRLYSKLSGMTGTADTEAFEFRKFVAWR
jgi:preprotein translocase subunit SecA